jgi:hypothetical protein
VSGDEADETVGGAASTDEAETAPSSE